MRCFLTNSFQSTKMTNSLPPSTSGEPIPIVTLPIRIPFLIGPLVFSSSTTKINCSCKKGLLTSEHSLSAGLTLAALIQTWSSWMMDRLIKNPSGIHCKGLCTGSSGWTSAILPFISWIRSCTSNLASMAMPISENMKLITFTSISYRQKACLSKRFSRK